MSGESSSGVPAATGSTRSAGAAVGETATVVGADLARGLELLDGAVVRGSGRRDDDRRHPGTRAEELLVRPLLELVRAAGRVGRLDQLRAAEERRAEARAAAEDVDLRVVRQARRQPLGDRRAELDRLGGRVGLEVGLDRAPGELGRPHGERVERPERGDVRDRPRPEPGIVVAEGERHLGGLRKPALRVVGHADRLQAAAARLRCSLDRAHDPARVRHAHDPRARRCQLELVPGELERLDRLRRDPAPALEGEPGADPGEMRVAAAGQVDPRRRLVEQLSRLREQLVGPAAEPVRLHVDALQHRLPAELDAGPGLHASAFAAFAWISSSDVAGSYRGSPQPGRHSITASARGSWKKTIVWRRLPTASGRRHSDAVQRRRPAVVRPARHHVAEVDDERAGDGVDVDPLARPRLHLEPAGRVLGAEDRHAAVVGVRAGAQLARLDLAVGRRVVDHAHARRVSAEGVLEPVLGEAEGEREQPPQPLAEPGDGGEVLLEARPQLRGRAGQPKPGTAGPQSSDSFRSPGVFCPRLAARLSLRSGR